MILVSKPCSNLKGSVRLPASKSYSIRAFIAAACGGKSVLKYPSYCDDAKVALRMARALGSKIAQNKQDVFTVEAGHKKAQVKEINVNESGTALRFMLPLVTQFTDQCRITGQGTLRGRPNAFLTKSLRSQGADIRGMGPKEGIPVIYRGGSLKGGTLRIDGSISSQFISALLITLPLLKKDTLLKLTGRKLVSLDYITMTLQILKLCGIQVKKISDRDYRIKGGQTYKGLKNFSIPSDYGLAAFLLAGAALVKSDVNFTGVFNDKLIQADGHILDFLKKMGVKAVRTKTSLKMKGPFRLKGGKFSLRACPDLVPIMSVLALFAEGPTRLCDIAHARVKESDRISDLRKELLKIGADVSETKNELIIRPKTGYKDNVLLDPHHDHRLAMSFAVLGLKHRVRIKDMECVNKSYPDFVKDFRKIGAAVFRART